MIIKFKYDGKLKRGELLSNWEVLFNDKTFRKTNNNVLLDYENVEIEFNSDDYNQILAFFENNCNYIVRRKIGVIATKPLLSCFLYLIGEKINENTNCYLKIFLNEQDAMDWLVKLLPLKQ
ncbi:MAG: hypothetical protein A2W99_02695 [Bacteroidetes bacterium GWF2_33_16]|nr:MAG: hypothetical protein A2X00_07900 [Bacteroidetes bacterium GWE2_32_14]OFY07375.1 MAG: hypothetical protein A2W99_02695 [Bacteroidetes bacterium GWF2_33_16]